MHPTFICIGAQKAGTDWFYDQFAAHKDFWMPPIKEIAFFDKGFGPSRIKKANRQIRWKRIKHEEKKADYALDIEFLETMLGAEPDFRNYDFQVYFDLFDGKPGRTGDCTPGYCRVDVDMAREMLRQMPETVFLLAIRDPAERVWSQALMHERLGRNPGMQVVDDFEDFKTFCNDRPVTDLSFLSRTIKVWQEAGAGDRFRVYNFDDLRTDPDAYRNDVAAFVGADPDGFELPANYNKKAKQPNKKKIPTEWRAFLAQHFEQEFKDLAELMGGKAIGWLERNEAILQAERATS